MQRSFHDNVCYIYNNSTVTYTQLMLAARKAETEVLDPKSGRTILSKAAIIENEKGLY